jgi:hypothetical protein
MNFAKLLDLAAKMNLPGLVTAGAAFVSEVKAAADRAPHIMTEADRAELDAIHADALTAADRLDAKLAEAEKR